MAYRVQLQLLHEGKICPAYCKRVLKSKVTIHSASSRLAAVDSGSVEFNLPLRLPPLKMRYLIKIVVTA